MACRGWRVRVLLPAIGGTEFDNFRLDEKNGTSLAKVLDLRLDPNRLSGFLKAPYDFFDMLLQSCDSAQPVVTCYLAQGLHFASFWTLTRTPPDVAEPAELVVGGKSDAVGLLQLCNHLTTS